ncbi:MAG: Na/Pi cotransporter family protein [Ruminococcus sp.]|nr:Na/Pi cotransporter family protein [Ruminococcus sp.]
MTIFDALNLIGGLCLFLFGMNIMGQALERRAGNKLKTILGKLTSNRFLGFLTGLGVTAVIQSSSATTVMVVGFVNSGLMSLRQSINVIMGANVGTTITAWILSLGGIDSDNVFIKLLKPTSFTPVLALIGIIFYMFFKDRKKTDTGMILLGFATLMFGMDTMSDAVSGLRDVPAFGELFIMFSNPVLGVLAGAILTAIIQSSSASVGILQALASTGQVSYGAAVPIIMGQNIGTCVTALLSSFGTNKNAKRAAFVHLSFNVIGTTVWLTVFTIIKYTLSPVLFDQSASLAGIAVAHSIFNIACTVLLFPMSRILEKIVYKFIPETAEQDEIEKLDERFLATPAVALERCHAVGATMADYAIRALSGGLECLRNYSEEKAEEVRTLESKTDKYEDIMGSYLVRLSSQPISRHESTETTKLIKIIGDLERIADHGVNLVESAEELQSKGMTLSDTATSDFDNIANAVEEVLLLTRKAFVDNDMEAAYSVDPLEEVVDVLKERMRTSHIKRLQQGKCSIEGGFVLSDLLTNLERTSDHCSNIAGSVIETSIHKTDAYYVPHSVKVDMDDFKQRYHNFAEKYLSTTP